MEGKEFLLHGIAARELRVVAHAVHAVISVELRHLFSTYGCDICQYRAPAVGGQAAVRNAGNARNGHAVLVRHVEECAGHAAERSRPVAPVRHVGPHGEYFGVEHAVGQRVAETVVHGNPRQEFLVVGGGEAEAHLRSGVAEAFAGLHAGDEEVVVFTHLRAYAPSVERLVELVAARAPGDVPFLQLLCGSTECKSGHRRNEDNFSHKVYRFRLLKKKFQSLTSRVCAKWVLLPIPRKGVDALKGLGIGYWILYMVFAMMSP